MLTAALPLNTLAQPNAAAGTTHTPTQQLRALHTREETDLFVLANKFTPTSQRRSPAQSHVVQGDPKSTASHRHTHRLLVLLLGAAGLLGLLNDGVERETQAAHARQVRHVYVKLHLLVPERLGAHGDLRARHHLTQQLAAVEEAGLHYKLQGKHRYTVVIRQEARRVVWKPETFGTFV